MAVCYIDYDLQRTHVYWIDLRYSSGWKFLLRNHSYYNIVGQLSTPGSQNWSVFALSQMTQRYRSMSDTKYPKKEFWFYLYLPWSCSSNKVKDVNFIVINSVASFDTMQNCDGFWLPGARSFPTVYYMNDFAAIISSRYYTLITLQLMSIAIPLYYIANKVVRQFLTN